MERLNVKFKGKLQALDMEGEIYWGFSSEINLGVAHFAQNQQFIKILGSRAHYCCVSGSTAPRS